MATAGSGGMVVADIEVSYGLKGLFSAIDFFVELYRIFRRRRLGFLVPSERLRQGRKKVSHRLYH